MKLMTIMGIFFSVLLVQVTAMTQDADLKYSDVEHLAWKQKFEEREKFTLFQEKLRINPSLFGGSKLIKDARTISYEEFLTEFSTNSDTAARFRELVLCAAAKCNASYIITLLLQYDINPDFTWDNGKIKISPLCDAIQYNCFDAAQVLLQHGADVNAQSYFGRGATALQLAVIADNTKMVQLLLAYGPDLNKKSSTLERPIDFARTVRKTHLISLLEEAERKQAAAAEQANV